MFEKLINGINTVLMLDVFFVIFCFVWFLVGLLGRQLGIPLGFDVWYSLWPNVIQPAIGLVMAGSILTGIVGQIRKRMPSSQEW